MHELTDADRELLYEFNCWRAFRAEYVMCEVCDSRIRRTSAWAWVRDTHGRSIRICFTCIGRSVLLLPAPELVEDGDG